MPRSLALAVLVLAGAAPLAAQTEDSATPAPRTAQSLRRQIEDRFAARVQEELRLSDTQAAQLRATVDTYGDRRRALVREERRVRAAVAVQLRPGVAADRDSVGRLVDTLAELKVRYAQTFRDELQDMEDYLDPVQRAQFFALRERLLRRVEEFRHRGEGPRRRR